MTAPESNRNWGRTILGSLLRAGVGQFFVSPGARSVPLVAALAELPAKLICAHFDERGAAFAALGWIKATGRPAACVTTSGSAVANLHPAVLEASHSDLPLVLITADRPPELRGTGANQTVHQPGIFGPAVRWAADFPCPDSNLLAIADALATEAVTRAMQPHTGPVHLNLPFREPLLEPDSPRLRCKQLPLIPKTFAVSEECPVTATGTVPPGFFDSARGVILVGGRSVRTQSEIRPILRLASRLAWPVFADPLSGMKGAGPQVIDPADFLLPHPSAPAPERVLHLGGKVVSKRVARYFAHLRCADYVHVDGSPAKLDPLHQMPVRIRESPSLFCEESARSMAQNKNSGWLAGWLRAAHAAESLLARELQGKQSLSEPGLARLAASMAKATGACLFLGNSMPIRDFDAFAGEAARRVKIVGNRGASGIDGNIATIAGLARGIGKRVIGLLGDLAALHDLNSLALLAKLPVTLLVANNQGGGIFRFLPMAMPPAHREKWVETPHRLNFRNAAAQFGIAYLQSGSADEISDFVCGMGRGPLLVEVPGNRAQNFQFHKRLAAQLRRLPDPWRKT